MYSNMDHIKKLPSKNLHLQYLNYLNIGTYTVSYIYITYNTTASMDGVPTCAFVLG
jgi:hypothetical protein